MFGYLDEGDAGGLEVVQELCLGRIGGSGVSHEGEGGVTGPRARRHDVLPDVSRRSDDQDLELLRRHQDDLGRWILQAQRNKVNYAGGGAVDWNTRVE